jgi:hypothetical protein
MATKPSDLSSGHKYPLLFMQLPAEIRLRICELALEDILTQIEASTSSYYHVRGTKLDCRGALALILTSKAIRAEFSDGVLPLVTAHCEDFSSRVKMLKLDWEVKITTLGRPQPGQATIKTRLVARLNTLKQEWRCNVAMQALFKVRRIMERTVEEFKPKLNSFNNVEDERFKKDL